MPLTVVLAVGMDSLFISTSRPVLQSAGYVVISTRTVKEAMDQFKVGDFDLVFLDDSITTEDRTILTVMVRLFGSRTPIVCGDGFVSDGELFADGRMEGLDNVLAMGFGALISEMARLRPVFPRASGNLPPEEARSEASTMDGAERPLQGRLHQSGLEPGKHE